MTNRDPRTLGNIMRYKAHFYVLMNNKRVYHDLLF